MESLLKKFRILTLGNLHDFFDAMIDLNSPAAVRQYIRDLEAGTRQVEHAANIVEGALRTTRDDLDGVRNLMKTYDQDIDALIGDDNPANDGLALPMQVEFNAADNRVAGLEAREAKQQKMLDDLNGAIAKLNAKHAELMAVLKDIEAKTEAGKGMEEATEAVVGVAEMSVDAPSVDSLARKVNEKYNQQGAAFDRAMGKLSDATEDDLAISQAEAALARRKQKLAGQTDETPDEEAAAAAAGTTFKVTVEPD